MSSLQPNRIVPFSKGTVALRLISKVAVICFIVLSSNSVLPIQTIHSVRTFKVKKVNSSPDIQVDTSPAKNKAAGSSTKDRSPTVANEFDLASETGRKADVSAASNTKSHCSTESDSSIKSDKPDGKINQCPNSANREFLEEADVDDGYVKLTKKGSKITKQSALNARFEERRRLRAEVDKKDPTLENIKYMNREQWEMWRKRQKQLYGEDEGERIIERSGLQRNKRPSSNAAAAVPDGDATDNQAGGNVNGANGVANFGRVNNKPLKDLKLSEIFGAPGGIRTRMLAFNGFLLFRMLNSLLLVKFGNLRPDKENKFMISMLMHTYAFFFFGGLLVRGWEDSYFSFNSLSKIYIVIIQNFQIFT